MTASGICLLRFVLPRIHLGRSITPSKRIKRIRASVISAIAGPSLRQALIAVSTAQKDALGAQTPVVTSPIVWTLQEVLLSRRIRITSSLAPRHSCCLLPTVYSSKLLDKSLCFSIPFQNWCNRRQLSFTMSFGRVYPLEGHCEVNSKSYSLLVVLENLYSQLSRRSDETRIQRFARSLFIINMGSSSITEVFPGVGQTVLTEVRL